jgi:hypothetical protein
MSRLWRTVSVRFINHPPGTAAVRWTGATWWCACAAPIPLQGESGAITGPTCETVVTCPDCGRAFFIIPHDRSHSRPIEVVELAAIPVASGAGRPGPESESDAAGFAAAADAASPRDLQLSGR